MKHLLFCIALLCLHFNNAFSQQDGIEDQLKEAMSTLDYSQVPSGILLEKIPPYINLADLRGTYLSDSTEITKQAFLMAYGMIDQAHTKTSKMTPIIKLWEEAEVLEKSDVLHLGLLYYEYDRFFPQAFEDNLIYFQNDHFYDSPNRRASPYEADACFVGTSFRQEVSDTKLTFSLNSEWFFTNTGEKLDVLEIDFDNGSGWQTFKKGEKPVINYPGTGSYKIKMKYTTLAGKDLICQTPLEIVAPPKVSPPPANRSILADSYPILPKQLTDVDGVDISYFRNRLCGDKKITHPLIVVEGFDEEDANDWTDLMSEELDDNGIPKGLLAQIFNTQLGTTNLKDKLHENQYDIFYINWHDGGAHIEENAQILKDVIRQINTWKAEDGSVEDNIIIGASMGGLVSKWALREMELAGEDHQTEFFISFDSPMNGANIPLGLQYWVDDMANYKIFGTKLMDLVGAMKQAYNLVNADAAKDMLYYHYQASNCTDIGDDQLVCDANDLDDLHTAFMTQFDALGDLDIPHYSIANGSLNLANQLFPQDYKLFDFNKKLYAPLLRLHFDLDFWSLTSNSLTKIYHGNKRLRIGVWPLTYTIKRDIDIFVQNAIPYDNAPGGMRGFPSKNIELPFGLGEIPIITFKRKSFCFIPTISALDLDNVTNPFFDATDELALTSDGSTPVSSYTGPTTPSLQYGYNQINQKHVTLSNKSANFLLYYFIEGYDLEFMNAGSTLSNQTFNLGRTDEHVNYTSFIAGETKHTIDFDLTVTNQGKLWINRNAPLGFTSGPYQGPMNINPTHFNAFLHGECDDPVTMTLRDGGEVYIGEQVVQNNPGIYNTGNFYIDNGATLLIKDDGTLRLDEDSKLVVREGGHVKIEAGGRIQTTNPSAIVVEDGGILEIDAAAKIHLWWGSSTIHVKEGGELIINGEFDMGDGDGYFQFDNGNILTLTDDLSITGQGNSKRLIRLNPHAVLNIETHDLILKYALIENAHNSKIQISPGSAIDLYAVNFVADENINYGSVGLDIEDPRQVKLFGCDFTNYDVGVKLYNFDPADGLSLILLDFLNCNWGMNVEDGSSFSIATSSFNVGAEGLVGISIADVTDVTISGSTFNDYESVSVGALKMNTVNTAFLSGCRFRNNQVGVSLKHVRDLTVSGSLLERNISSTSTSPSMGIYIPHNINTSLYNISNVTLQKNTRIERYDIGIQVDKGGKIDGVNVDFGKVKMDCAKLKYNDIGIRGEDVKLEIDAFDHCNCTDPNLAVPNSFIKLSGQFNNQKFFDICYDQISVGTTSARSNYWSTTPSPGTDYILGFCGNEPSPVLGLDASSPVATEPTNCNPGGLPPKYEIPRRSTDFESLGEIDLQVFPNPTTNSFEILAAQGTYQLTIYNSVGMKVWEEASFSGNSFIESANWPKGLYLIQIIDQVSSKKYLARQVIQ